MPERVVEPHGLLLGHRSYLVARQPARGEDMLNFRMDRIHSAQTLDESFSLSPGFSLADYAARSFGVYQDPEQYSEVVWRFAPAAAGRARSEEHTSELQSLMRISYAVFCLTQKK